jgi:hypothetical protein
MSSDISYLSASDLARRYKIHLMTVWKWRASGVLPPGELVGPATRRWRSDEIEKFEANRAKESEKADD